MLPSILAKQLQEGIGDYIETTFPMTNEPFKGSVHNMLETKDSVYHEPYVAVQLPFRVADEMPTCFNVVQPSFLPYVHQSIAYDRLTGEDGRSTLIATGTGSGKTECFLYPILEYCYSHRGERGIKALIIYPMNALASDQSRRIAELIYNNPDLKGEITAGMYVGGYSKNASRMMTKDSVITDHDTMLNNPPDILMTNYKMLDYLLVRPKDAALWKDNDPETLKYIAVDELHTFDGAQGTDLACLLRRLKTRLWIPAGYLCCIGTSATMGSKDSYGDIIDYASNIFGEPFEPDSVITEDRLSPDEFFAGSDITDFTMPTNAQLESLNELTTDDDEDEFLKLAVSSWIADFDDDVLSDEGRIKLSDCLMHHSFFRAVISLMNGNYYQASTIADELETSFPDLRQLQYKELAVNSLFALVSHARTGEPGKLRPFLNVNLQLWMRELRRLVAKVSDNDVTYALAQDLNSQQAKQYLPVVNCRDCGATGWVSVLNARQNATLPDLDTFYNMYFRADDQVMMMFPHKDGDLAPKGTQFARLCPECLQVNLGDEGNTLCPKCGSETVRIVFPSPVQKTGSKSNPQYVCPFCGSRRGLSLMGLRSATEISASLSQMFSSKFNDDKKTLAFSDNVQDAAHRAGFFNSRTWRFGLRGAIQRYCQDGGDGESLEDFQQGFIKYWHAQLSDEDFVSQFIAPNMTWMKAYEDMVENRKLGSDSMAKKLISDIENRLRYEILLEYGVAGKIGRTLEKSGCSTLAFPNDLVEKTAATVQERVINEQGILSSCSLDDFYHMTIEFLQTMKSNGAFADPVFNSFIQDKGNTYKLSADNVRWMPGLQSGRNTPRFIIKQKIPGKKLNTFDHVSDKKYIDCIASCSSEVLIEDTDYTVVSGIILEELVHSGLVVELSSPPEYTAYGLNKEKLYITTDVTQMRCDTCGAVYPVATDNVSFWSDTPCMHSNCGGTLYASEDTDLNYYKMLYSTGDIVRINAREHTGLLERDEREELETDFKRDKTSHKLWDPNVLSCTPTLEMGIDIGDLSSVVLCSVPPSQAQYLQRVGRAGRKDGNALTLAIANARPHDLYFYADPMDMMAGSVVPPRVFLRASAVLERQFIAFCMDSWVKRGIPDGAIPKNVGMVLQKLDTHASDVFPYNFLNFVQNNLTRQLNAFVQMFAGVEDWSTAEEEIRDFARGKPGEKSPMYVKIYEAFANLKKQQDSLQDNVKQLNVLIKELENKPKDSSYDKDIAELRQESTALLNVIHSLQQKDIFNFLSDEGLLPNYAFPEAGVVLRAVLYRKEDDNTEESDPAGKNKYQKMVYEYNRSASSAISEFAPNNTFYVDGRKLAIDQVDLTTTEPQRWRLCPNCSHAELEDAVKNRASCPKCGSPAWADSGQIRSMLKMQMVYANADYTKSLITDESDDRSSAFYCRQILVDVDEQNDVSQAYRMDNTDFPFGYEFVRKATLREINFGEKDMFGEHLMVSGKDDVRKGFRICKHCGKIQSEHGNPRHSLTCITRKMNTVSEDDYEDCLFLYREFSTEILRLLIPATTMASTSVRTESFTAAFMLGMKEYFGNVDHLRATVCEIPVQDADYRKQYLVIYDSVPGGTGYLEQLMHDETSLSQIFEKALNVLETCSCNDDPQKDGCYHCLYAYRQSQNIGNISREAAKGMLRSILSGRENLEKIDTISSIPVNSLFDSELEERFVEAFSSLNNEDRHITIEDMLINNKHGYLLKINDVSWEIEPQVPLDAEQNVKVQSKPDFILRPLNAQGKLPVAVFTDGFAYHKDIVASDTLKREAIRRSGHYRVWSLSYKDVQNAFEPQGDYASSVFATERMPSGLSMYYPLIRNTAGEKLNLTELSPFELLVDYLYMPDAEEAFKNQATAISWSLLDPQKASNNNAFSSWNDIMSKVADEANFVSDDFEFGKTFFGVWSPRNDYIHLRIYAGALAEKLQKDRTSPIYTIAVLNDDKETHTDKYQQEWNGFWQFFNVMQFSDSFMAVSSTGLKELAYLPLPVMSSEASKTTAKKYSKAWQNVLDLVIDDEVKNFIDKLVTTNSPVPDEVGYELEGKDGEVIATIELAWTAEKIAYLTEEQMADLDLLESLGWTIISDSTDLSSVIFGGNQ